MSLEAGLRVDVFPTEFAGLLDTVYAHHVTPVRGVVTQKFSTNLTRVTLCVSMRHDMFSKARLKKKLKFLLDSCPQRF